MFSRIFTMVALALVFCASVAQADGVPFKVGDRIRETDVQIPGLLSVLKLGASEGGLTPTLIYATLKSYPRAGGGELVFPDQFYLFRAPNDGTLTVTDIFSLGELSAGRVLINVDHVPILGSVDVVTARLTGFAKGGGLKVSISVLRDATNVLRSRTAVRELVLTPNGASEIAASYGGKRINNIDALLRRSGTQTVGIRALRFYAPDGSLVAESAL
jgi:hypothetical protein